MGSRTALTREPSARLDHCQLSFKEREPVDHAMARQQHAAYETWLQNVGCRLERIAPEPDLPDGVFVEDCGVVFDHVAVVTRPGSSSRRLEIQSVADALQSHRELRIIEAPGTLDGGDVLVIGNRVYVGESIRTNWQGIEQLRRIIAPMGFRVTTVPVRNCLHLKTAATVVGDDTILVNPQLCDAKLLVGHELIEVDPNEVHAANALLVNGQVLYPASFPLTAEKLEHFGVDVTPIDMSEFQKVEGGVTCCSIVFES